MASWPNGLSVANHSNHSLDFILLHPITDSRRMKHWYLYTDISAGKTASCIMKNHR